MKRPLLFIFFALFYLSGIGQTTNPKPSKPNILLIVADDLGYADLGCYGGDIATPNIDALAKNGLRFSRYHTAPVCAETRAMLLSGNNNHIAGMGRQDLKTGYEGYEGHLSERIIPMPVLLGNAGYHTCMAGKWHLGRRPEDNPAAKGFDHSFAMLEGGANHYSEKGVFYDVPITPYTEDGTPAHWPEGKFSSDFYTDKIISFIEDGRRDGRPFFAYAAYTSPHWPLQADEKYWKKYAGKYDNGYELLKASRFESLKKAGIIPENAILPQSHPGVRAWSGLSAAEQKREVRKMELYAGMVDNLDENIGRLITYLKSIGQFENTLIVFMSDNGAAGEDFFHHATYGPFLKENYTEDYDSMGMPVSFISYGPQWAEAGTAPFKFYKGFTTEGGIVAPLIISGKMVKEKGNITDGFFTVMDVAPTFYALAGTNFPADYHGNSISPLKGKSLLPILFGKKMNVHGQDYVFGLEHEGFAMVRKGDWKIVNIERPFNLANFRLFNLRDDLGEQFDRKEDRPEKFREMLLEWEKFSKEIKVIIPTPKQGEGL